MRASTALSLPLAVSMMVACSEDVPGDVRDAMATEAPMFDAGSDQGPDDAGASDTGVAADMEVMADGGEADAGGMDLGPMDAGAGPQDTLVVYLLGDFDNRDQFDRGFPQLVERHVCPMPGLPEEPDVEWLYVEHVEHVEQGRDAYFIRVNRLQTMGGVIVSKAYRFPVGQPLRTKAFAFNGPRDACDDTEQLGGVTVETLDYRAGCDVTFVDREDHFDAMSPEQTCTFPGGWIQTISTVYPDGLDSRDRVVTPEGEAGSTFEFRRIDSGT